MVMMMPLLTSVCMISPASSSMSIFFGMVELWEMSL